MPIQSVCRLERPVLLRPLRQNTPTIQFSGAEEAKPAPAKKGPLSAFTNLKWLMSPILGLGILLGSVSGCSNPHENFTRGANTTATSTQGFFSPRVTEGTFNGQHFRLESTRGWSSITLKGTFNGQPVNITSSRGLFNGRETTGTIGNAPVNLKAVQGWDGLTITGTIGNKAVNLTSQRNLAGRVLTGTIGDQQVNLHAIQNWSNFQIDGTVGHRDSQNRDEAFGGILSLILKKYDDDADDARN